MKMLIVEDDFTHRALLQECLKEYGPAHVAVNGSEAVEAVRAAMEAGAPYDLICLDIEMPELNGRDALKEIRKMEEDAGVLLGSGAKIIMTTASRDGKDVMGSFREACDAYLCKPVEKGALTERLRKFGLI